MFSVLTMGSQFLKLSQTFLPSKELCSTCDIHMVFALLGFLSRQLTPEDSLDIMHR